MDLIELTNKHCCAIISTQGAQLLHWKPHDQLAPVLWCSDQRHWLPGVPLRGGIPICWPWFGKLQQPSHGFARTQRWQLSHRSEHESMTMLDFELVDSPSTRALWPHPFALQLRMELGRECKLSLQIDCAQATTGALHSYFHVGDITASRVNGLGETYQDALQALTLTTCTNDLAVQQAVDRIYTQPESITQLTDTRLQRQITLQHQHHSDLVVWNPWSAGASALADMTPSDYRHMLCIETACINAPLIHSLALTIQVGTR